MPRILVIDDHAATRALLVSALAPAGHEVIEAGEDVPPLEAARQARPDLVICDIFMPAGDGYELVQMLRRDPLLAHVPVIFYTAHFHRREAVALARACGVTCVLTKPTTAADILNTVDAVLAGESQQPEAREGEVAPDFLRLVSNKLVETAGELEWTSSRLMALMEMCLELTAAREPSDMVRIVSRGTRDLVAARHAVVALWEPGVPSTSHVAVSGLSEEAAAAVEAGLTSSTPHPTPLAAREPLRRAGPVSDADDLGLPWAYPPVGTMLVVPVKSPNRDYGWICATSRISGDAFSPEDERLLTIFAAYLARVFENSCLLAELSRRSRQLETEVAQRSASQWRAELQCAVATALAVASTLDEAAPQMLRAICTLGGFAVAELWEIDEAKGRLRHVETWHEAGLPIDAFLEETRTLTFGRGQGLPGRVWEAEMLVWLACLRDEPSFLRAASADAAGLKSGIGFPVVVRGRLSGVLCVFGQVGRPPDVELRTLFQAVGAQVGQFIERRRQEARLVRLSRIPAMLAQAGSLIGSGETRRGLFQRACTIAVEQGGFAVAQVYVKEADGTLTVAAASGPAAAGTSGMAAAEQVFRSGEPVIDNLRGLGRPREGALAALPLAHGGRVRAALVLHAETTGVFEGAELVLVRQMAADVSLALDALESQLALRLGAASDAV